METKSISWNPDVVHNCSVLIKIKMRKVGSSLVTVLHIQDRLLLRSVSMFNILLKTQAKKYASIAMFPFLSINI